MLAGRINVAICPGPDLAAITASAPSLAMSFDDFDVLTWKILVLRYPLYQPLRSIILNVISRMVPTIFTIGVCAFALCRLASPFQVQAQGAEG